MITFPAFSDERVLKPVIPYRFCALCLKKPVMDLQRSCLDCLYPYDDHQALVHFDYDDYRRYSQVNLDRVVAHLKGVSLRHCAFCGACSYLDFKSVHLYDLYQANEFRNSIVPVVLNFKCTGCTLSTPFLYLYQFYLYQDLLMDAWHSGESISPLIKYIDLRLPEWSINYQLLKAIKKYASEYQQRFKSQQSLFDDPAPLSKRQRAAQVLETMVDLWGRN